MKKLITRMTHRASPARLALASSLASCSLASSPARAESSPMLSKRAFPADFDVYLSGTSSIR